MRATAKMKAFGLDELRRKTGKNLVTIYRWIREIESGEGIRDVNKRLLIAATAGTPHALSWSDFDPAQAAAA